jgi:peptide/nickel transport system permease protein
MTYLGPATAMTMTGSFVIEKVFHIPGLGQHFVDSVTGRDQPLILGVVMVESALLLVFNLLVDVAYGWLDPRIDITAKAG